MEVRVSEDEFVNGKVVQTYGKEGLYDIEIEVSGLIIRNVSADDIRRFDLEETLEVGRKVVAAFQGGEEWFPGRVVRVNKDGSYGIKYNDGDFEPKLEREFVRAVKDHATSI